MGSNISTTNENYAETFFSELFEKKEKPAVIYVVITCKLDLSDIFIFSTEEDFARTDEENFNPDSYYGTYTADEEERLLLIGYLINQGYKPKIIRHLSGIQLKFVAD